MAKKANELIVQPPNVVPSYLMEYAGSTGLENSGQYVRPPRLKIVQKQSGPPITDAFNAGDVIAMPQMLLLKAMEYVNNKPVDDITPLTFVPVFWFPEWCTWNPIALKGTEPAVLERTLDPNSPLAKKSKSKATWTEDHPTLAGHKVRHVEHLVFVVVLDNGPMAGVPMTHSFMRGEHNTGSALLSLARMRKAPLYVQRFQMTVSQRTNQQGSWYGFNPSNVSVEGVSPWVEESSVGNYRSMYEDLKQAYDANLLQADHGLNDDSAPAPSDTTEF
jgi:hypothetical protein